MLQSELIKSECCSLTKAYTLWLYASQSTIEADGAAAARLRSTSVGGAAPSPLSFAAFDVV
ncbi:MAG: hypothetical protein ACKERG_04215 [Candidatus Hodgkinia cicadicola]